MQFILLGHLACYCLLEFVLLLLMGANCFDLIIEFGHSHSEVLEMCLALCSVDIWEVLINLHIRFLLQLLHTLGTLGHSLGLWLTRKQFVKPWLTHSFM